MITRIMLSGWKAFDSVEIELDVGTTFILSSNGIGKSSLIDGALWALFGPYYLKPDSNSYIRGGHNQAACEIDFRFGEVAGTVRRTLSRGRSSIETTIDGNTESDVDAILAQHSDQQLGVDLATLSGLAAMREGSVYQDDARRVASLTNALSEALGLGRARQACDELRTLKGRWNRSGDAIRKRSQLPSDRRQELDRNLEQIAEDVRAQELGVAEAEEKLVALQQELQVRQEWARYEEARQEHERRFRATVQQAQDLGVPIRHGEDLQEQLREELARVAEEQSSKEREVGAVESQVRQFERGGVLLSEATEVCPTCLRPLDEEVTQAASAHRESEIARLRTQLEEAQAALRSYQERGSRLQDLIQAAQAPAPEPPVQQQGEQSEQEQLEESIERQRETLRQLTEQLGSKREEERQVRSTITEDDAAAAEEEKAISYYRRAAAANILHSVLEEAVERQSSEMVQPISSALSGTWKQLWGRGTRLGIGEGGQLELEGITSVPFANFSGGEKSFSSVLVRLIALSSLSAYPFIWLDEPLEHLDPGNRRTLAALLARVSSQGAFRQVVVTTYEEHVARRLSSSLDGMNGGATLQYVRGAETQ